MQRVGSSSRPVAHNSDVDFDQVPSPRASPSFASRRALANANASRTRTSIPSRLSYSTVAQDDDVESDIDPGPPNYDYGGSYGDDMDLDSPPPPASRTPRKGQTPRRTSFANLDQEADVQDEGQLGEQTDYGRSPSAKALGKQRMVYENQYEEMEPDIAQGLNDVEEEPIEEEADQPAPVQRKGKKGKEDKASKNSRKENDGAPRGRPRGKKVVLREGMFHCQLPVYAVPQVLPAVYSHSGRPECRRLASQ